MTITGIASEDYDLDLLDAYLSSPDQPDEVMVLSQLDGYLTAIAIAPVLIMPSQWLPKIWGSESPPFSDLAVATAIIGAIHGLYNDNLQALADDSAPFELIVEPDVDGSAFIELWCEGFVSGVALRLDDWKPLLVDKEASPLLFPFTGLVANADGEYGVDLSDKERERLRKRAPRLIPGCVRAIREYWLERGVGPGGLLPPRTRPSRKSVWLRQRDVVESIKIGRNAPCPCGSGKKYKRCCGAN